MTDYLNAFERGFLALTDVVMESLDGSTPPVHREFVAVAVRHIVLAGTEETRPLGSVDARPTEAVAAGPPPPPAITQGF